MPWRHTKDPYRIWLSEIILQQTTIKQGTPYYLKFIEGYPTIKHLAEADLDAVMKLWEGLGYYSRARNLHQTAQNIYSNLKGQFPSTYKGLLALKGVGPYTAAAIGSIAFGLPEVVVDGNVLRVMSRLNGIQESIDELKTKKQIHGHGHKLLEASKRYGDFNQALMELGATVCTYKKPLCGSCPLRRPCLAQQKDMVERIPKRSKKLKKKTRHFHYFHIEDSKGRLYFKQRTEKDIWQHLFELPMIEHEREVKKLKSYPSGIPMIGKAERICERKQLLSHQKIQASFFKIATKAFIPTKKSGLIRAHKQELDSFAWPRIVHLYLTQIGYL